MESLRIEILRKNIKKIKFFLFYHSIIFIIFNIDYIFSVFDDRTEMCIPVIPRKCKTIASKFLSEIESSPINSTSFNFEGHVKSYVDCMVKNMMKCNEKRKKEDREFCKLLAKAYKNEVDTEDVALFKAIGYRKYKVLVNYAKSQGNQDCTQLAKKKTTDDGQELASKCNDDYDEKVKLEGYEQRPKFVNI